MRANYYLLIAMTVFSQFAISQITCRSAMGGPAEYQFPAGDASGREITTASSLQGPAEFETLKIKSAYLFIKDQAPKETTYILVNADLKKMSNGFKFAQVGIEIPSRLFPFKKGTNERIITHDLMRRFADGSPVNGYIEVVVKGKMAKVTQVETEDLGYGVAIEGYKYPATSRVKTSELLITLDAQGQPTAVDASYMVTLGLPDGQSMTGPQSGQQFQLTNLGTKKP